MGVNGCELKPMGLTCPLSAFKEVQLTVDMNNVNTFAAIHHMCQ